MENHIRVRNRIFDDVCCIGPSTVECISLAIFGMTCVEIFSHAVNISRLSLSSTLGTPSHHKSKKKGRYAVPGSEGSKGSAGKVDGASPRGLWPPDGVGLCSLRSRGDGLSGRGLWYRPAGDEYEVSVTDLPFCVIRHEKHYVDQPPPVAFLPLVPYGTTFPPRSGGTIKLRKAILS